LRKPIRPKVELLWLSTIDRGRELEIHTEFGGFAHAAATIVADEGDESLWLQLEVAQTQVQIPLSVLRDALASASDVHSETWFERNVEGYPDPDLTPAARALLKRGDSGNDT
jgi:hypothetical protein